MLILNLLYTAMFILNTKKTKQIGKEIINEITNRIYKKARQHVS